MKTCGGWCRRPRMRLLFIRHVAFKAGVATVARADSLVLVCATPLWWQRFVDQCCVDRVPVAVSKGRPVAFCGVPVRGLDFYERDPDWVIILEALTRLKLLDIPAVFR